MRDDDGAAARAGTPAGSPPGGSGAAGVGGTGTPGGDGGSGPRGDDGGHEGSDGHNGSGGHEGSDGHNGSGGHEGSGGHSGSGGPGGARREGTGGAGGPGRNETPEERADRRWGDLLQELRVAQTGVQILFGFLLTVVFQQRFTELSSTDRHLYTVTVVLGAATTGALVGPVAMHRLLTGRRLKPETVVLASRLTVLGLVLLLCTMAASLLLVLRVAIRDTGAAWLVGAMVVWFVLCWLVLPLWARHRSRPGEDAPDGP